ncbi:hypothetical protein [Polyangium aurulentum]|uniref:hypothetical protein n=1 Tax=Polyangium aurulentum TaxID=2567896 RepID=UPI0010AEA494|nr:hypothetical protein [Polyangium aurulentum]UQA56410.1 hypothetical protein E8A73_034605 [Polyangium aurulentum]
MRGTWVAISLLVSLLACGSDEGPNDDPDAGDGKYRPPPSGVHTTEDAACKTLLDAHSKQMLTLGCAGTSPVCPNYLRVEYGGVKCMEYDKGSVDGCLAYFQMQSTCDALGDALADCLITAYPGTEPAGCATP